MDIVVLAAGIFVFLAHLLDSIFKRVRIPDILLWMLIGVLIGPVAHFVNPNDFGEVGKFMGVVTLVVILFESGLSLPLAELISAARKAVPFAMVTFFVTVAALAAVAWYLLDLSVTVSILTGFILGGTSSAVVIPLVTGLKASSESTAVLTLESALTDVLCIVGTIGIITGLAGEGIQTASLVASAFISLTLAAFLGVCSGIVWCVILDWVRKLENTMFATLAYALIVYGLAQYLGISGAIAAMALGITIGNVKAAELTLQQVVNKRTVSVRLHQLRTVERKLFKESVFLLKAFFFFYLGMTVKLDAFFGPLGLAALLLALVPLIPRLPIVRFLLPHSTPKREATYFWLLVPRGLAAAVLAQIPLQLGIPGEWPEVVASVCAMMVFLSISIIAILIFFAEMGLIRPITNIMFSPFADAPAGPPGDADDAPSSSESSDEEDEEESEEETQAQAEHDVRRQALVETVRAAEAEIAQADALTGDEESPELEGARASLEAARDALSSESEELNGALQQANDARVAAAEVKANASSDVLEEVAEEAPEGEEAEGEPVDPHAPRLVDLNGAAAQPYQQSEPIDPQASIPKAAPEWEEPPG